MEKILTNVKKLNDNFSTLDFNKVMAQSLKTDFNDYLFSNMLIGSGISILTDDGDFSHLSVNTDIFSGNPNLLRHS